MGKTTRKSRLDGEFGSFEGYAARAWRPAIIAAFDPDRDRARLEAARETWDHRHREVTDSTARADFAKLVRKDRRARTRAALHRGLTTGDWDDLVFPDDRDGKRFIWTVW